MESQTPQEALDGARLVRFHDDGFVGAVWTEGADEVTLYRVDEGEWTPTGSLDVDPGMSVDAVDTSIKTFLEAA